MSDKIELLPDAHLLLSSLRSVGYKSETAISDIIDNCISAHATEIHVDFVWSEEKSCILIYDNGEGMDHETLIASMKIGSADPSMVRNNDDLGRFGMGMKTAAFSLGKKLSVFSKKEDKVVSASWDLDFIEKQHNGAWSLNIDISEEDTDVNLLRKFESGTLVKIELLDRLVDIENIKKSKSNFYKTIEKVSNHVSLIFHRFIEEDELKIYFGKNLIEAWNPFVLDNNATQELSEEYIYGDKPVIIQPYVLPHKTKFNSEEELIRAQGFRGWNAHQGVYVYRNRRLLVYGTWFDFIKKEPAFNLARIKLDITSDADYDWKIDIKKSVATPPIYVRETLERVISVCTDASSKVYNSRGKYAKGTATQQLDYVWEQRKNRHGQYVFYLNRKHPIIFELMKSMADDQKENLKAYLALIEAYAPLIQSGLTSYLSNTSVGSSDDTTKQTDIEEAKSYIRNFLKNGFEKAEVENIILGMPNYKYIETEIKKIFEEEIYD